MKTKPFVLGWRATAPVLAIVTAILSIGAVDGAGQVDETAAARSDLRQLAAAYGALDGIYLRAELHVDSLRDARGTVGGQGTYELWISGEQYRVRSTASPSLGLANDIDVIYDGSQTYYFDRTLGVLAIEKGEASHIPTPLPNPLGLGFQFLPERPTCPGCRIDLRGLDDRGRWLSWRAGTAGSKTATGFRFTQKEDPRLAVEIDLDSFGPGRMAVPVRIAETLEGTSYEFGMSEYESLDTGSALVPIARTISMRITAASPGGRPGSTPGAGQEMLATMTISTLATDVDARDFFPDFDSARSIWDGQLDMFLQTGEAEMQ